MPFPVRFPAAFQSAWMKIKTAFRHHILPGASLWIPLATLWVGIMIFTPIFLWTLGDAWFPWMASLGVLVQGVATLEALRSGKSFAWAGAAFLAIAAGTWLAEVLGLATGFPFGDYHYTDLLQPQLGGVPLLIPVAWWMMLVPAWAAAEAILLPYRERLRKIYPVAFAAVGAAAMTAWDFYLDPQMVSRGLWIWDDPSGFFGIPWSNYFGWGLTAFVLTLAIRPSQLPRPPLLVIYTLTWVLQAIGQGIFWGQPGPAIVGFFAMGIFTVAAWRQEAKLWTS